MGSTACTLEFKSWFGKDSGIIEHPIKQRGWGCATLSRVNTYMKGSDVQFFIDIDVTSSNKTIKGVLDVR